MKTLKFIVLIALFTPWISRAEASPFQSQETLLTAEKQYISELDTISFKVDNNLNNQGNTFLISQAQPPVKRFPGATINTPSGVVPVPNAVIIKRGPDNSGVSKVIVSPTILQNVTSAGDKLVVNFAKNTLFNNPFSSQDLGTIATSTNTILAAGLEVTTDPITVTFKDQTNNYANLDEANAALYNIIADTGLTDGPVILNIYGVTVVYGIVAPVVP